MADVTIILCITALLAICKGINLSNYFNIKLKQFIFKSYTSMPVPSMFGWTFPVNIITFKVKLDKKTVRSEKKSLQVFKEDA